MKGKFKMKGFSPFNLGKPYKSESPMKQGYIPSRMEGMSKEKIKEYVANSGKTGGKKRTPRPKPPTPPNQKNKTDRYKQLKEKPVKKFKAGGLKNASKEKLIEVSKKFKTSPKKLKSSPMKQGVIRPMPKGFKGTEAEWRAQENANIKKMIERRNKLKNERNKNKRQKDKSYKKYSDLAKFDDDKG